MTSTSRWTVSLIVAALLASAAAGIHGAATDSPPAQPHTQALRDAITTMKANPRGPFRRIRWFCNDGSVLPPTPYACKNRGGGRQHGEWSAATKRIRAAGYPVANVLAGLAPEDFGESQQAQRHLRFLLLERFLMGVDDGWIMRKARFYRGALQAERERASAQAIVQSFSKHEEWRTLRFPLLVEATRLLAIEQENSTTAAVRGLASAINKEDADFAALRNKIHNAPDQSDAARVREYAKARGKPGLADQYATLVQRIDDLYRQPDPIPRIRALAPAGLPGERMREAADRLSTATRPAEVVGLVARLMQTIRDGLTDFPTEARIEALRLTLTLESMLFTRVQAAIESLEQDAQAGRRQRAKLLTDLLPALYGVGLLTDFEMRQLQPVVQTLQAPHLTLAGYRNALAYLDRVPGWAGRRLAFFFEEAIAELADIEPLAREYIPDRLRGSALLFFSRLLDDLATDASVIGGVRHELFGRTLATGLRGLNAGIGRGVLRTLDELSTVGDTSDSIVLVPHTLAELPPVAGILTENEGNALSHVQLLARNLGIPNVVVGADLIGTLRQHVGKRVALAVSPGGIVRLSVDSARTSSPQQEALRPDILVDLDKLDLDDVRLQSTSTLDAADSGVTVGPKAAQLGKLTDQFPDMVSPGLVIPFGVFRDLLELPRAPGEQSTFEWMKNRYRHLAAIEDAEQRSANTERFLAELRNWIQNVELSSEFQVRLRTAMRNTFGPEGSYGVFVRSDTNVEDLPGFTGAGLNLTVPNVVGFEATLAAIRRVWASPFTLRAFSWRQASMEMPEHVYAAVLLHAAVPADKSGVLITADVDTGERGVITVVTNEGVGGGVEGQSAETLKLGLSDGQTTLLNPATAPRKRVLLDDGGSMRVPTSGRPRILTDAELDALRRLVERLPNWFDNLQGTRPNDVIADVEFGFHRGQLFLFQIRPFVQNRGTAGDPMLQRLDERLRSSRDLRVDMTAPPLRS